MLENKTFSISVFLIGGTLTDLSFFDFSCANCQILPVESKKFEVLSQQFHALNNDHHYSLKNILRAEASDKRSGHHDIAHVLLPIDFYKPVDIFVSRDCINLIKLLYPSDLQIMCESKFLLKGGDNLEWQYSSVYQFYRSNGNYDNYFDFTYLPEIVNVNSFTLLYFQRISQLKYVRMAFDAYLSSFGPIPIHMSLISLCISMEAVVDGTAELIYRMRRTMALICGRDQDHGKLIYKNIKLIYNLRSSIVHGKEVNYDLLNDYLPYLKCIISNLIKNLIYLNIDTPEKLQERLVFVGFESWASDMGKPTSVKQINSLNDDATKIELRSK